MNAINFWQRKAAILYVIFAVGALQIQSVRGDVIVDKKTGLLYIGTNVLDMNFQTIVDSVRVKNDNAEKARTVSYDFIKQKKKLLIALMDILNDTNASKLNQGMAAYYLGEFHSIESADVLAQKIALNMDLHITALYQGLPMVGGFTARDALIKIGAKSVPFVIRNLSESDDESVRMLSLEVLLGIDGDKDIVQLRLKKTLKAEADAGRQNRLQAALKSLGGY